MVSKVPNIYSLLSIQLKVLKSGMKVANVWQFVSVATKLPSCGVSMKTAKVGNFDGSFYNYCLSDEASYLPTL